MKFFSYPSTIARPYVDLTRSLCIKEGGGRAEPPKGATPPPKGRLATLPTTPPPLVGGSAREVSDLAVSLNVVGVGVGAQW